MNISLETVNFCLTVLSNSNVASVLPDGSTNLQAVDQMRSLVTARQELLAAVSSNQSLIDDLHIPDGDRAGEDASQAVS